MMRGRKKVQMGGRWWSQSVPLTSDGNVPRACLVHYDTVPQLVLELDLSRDCPVSADWERNPTQETPSAAYYCI